MRSGSLLVTSTRRPGALGNEPSEVGGRLDHLLQVVEHEQALAVAEVSRKIALGPDGVGHCRQDESRVTERRQRYEPHPVGEGIGRLARGRNRKPCLAHAPRAGDRDDASAVVRQKPRDVEELLLPADERVGRNRQIRSVEALQRRELAAAELVEAYRRREILQPMLAEVAQLDRPRFEQRNRGRGRQVCPPWPTAAIRAARWTSMPT